MGEATIKVTREQVLEASKGMLQMQFYMVHSFPTAGMEAVMKNLPEHLDHQCAMERSGVMLAAVNNKPCSPRDDLSAFATIFSPPQTWPSALTRHNFLISSIFFSDVKSLFAILSIRSLPLAASRRSPLTVIPPWGKPYFIASSSRKGCSG